MTDCKAHGKQISYFTESFAQGKFGREIGPEIVCISDNAS